MLLSACGEGDVTGETTLPETSETETAVVEEETSEETTSTAVTTETETLKAAAEGSTEAETTAEIHITNEELYAYLAKNGYKFQYGTLYIDMNDYWDGCDPLEDISKEYMKEIYSLTIENAGSSDLSFLENYKFYNHLTLEGYSGNSDLSFLNVFSVILDDYRGGDLSFLSECGSVWLRFTNYNGTEDLSNITELDNIRDISFEYYDEDTDLSFLSECPNITVLRLINKRVNAQNIAELLNKTNISSLNIIVEEYSSKDAELIMKAAPDCSVTYIMDDSPWDYKKDLSGSLRMYTNLFVDTNELQHRDMQDSSNSLGEQTWGHHGSLICTFDNYTDEVYQVNSAEIYQADKDVFTPVPFADGSLVYETKLSIEPGSTDFEITEEMFPFSKCEKGVYKIVFNSDSGKTGQQFAVCSSDYSFLTDEQQDILNKAHEITAEYFGCSTFMPQDYIDTHTTEEFLENLYPAYTREYAYSRSLGTYIDSEGNLKTAFGDRGGNITVCANFFMPISSDENEVLLKNFVVHGHDDYPYFIWFEELNYHMVKTDDGWRFDNYRLWY